MKIDEEKHKKFPYAPTEFDYLVYSVPGLEARSKKTRIYSELA